MRTICDALEGMKTKWQVLGFQLGIPIAKLLEFKEEDDPLSAVVDYWLRGSTHVPISWKSITTVLQSPSIDEPGLAEYITTKYQLRTDNKPGQK